MDIANLESPAEPDKQPICARCPAEIDLEDCGEIVDRAIAEPDGGLHLCVICVCYDCFEKELAADGA